MAVVIGSVEGRGLGGFVGATPSCSEGKCAPLSCSLSSALVTSGLFASSDTCFGATSAAVNIDFARDFLTTSREKVGLVGMLASFNVLPLY